MNTAIPEGRRTGGFVIKKWFYRQSIYADVIGYIYADTKEEAIKKAEANFHLSVCHQCSDHLEIGDPTDKELEIEECT